MDIHFLQARSQLLDAPGEQAPIQFQLGFTRAAQTDRTAALAFKVRPATHQARGHVLELGQFDLELAFVRTRTLGEDVENQAGAIDHAALRQRFQIAFL